jgi:hypothetical protein
LNIERQPAELARGRERIERVAALECALEAAAWWR